MTEPEDSSSPSSAPDAPENHGLPALTPDVIEQEKGQGIDNIVPTEGFSKLPVVGLGGSAGGLAALQAFFGAMTPDCGMAFVVIMHLSPEHESILAEVLQRSTTMPVQQVRNRVKVEANQVYVIPPAKHLSMADGHLHLSELARTRPGKHVAVDMFFRTLADTHGPHAAAVVFSGADGDGAIGIKRIKERGGLTIAQDPGEAEQDSMPRATIATGMVDWVLPAAEIPAKLYSYWTTEQRLRLPAEEGPPPARESAATTADQPAATDETALHDVLGFLRAHTGRDFTYYKRATILRRVARRMQVNGIEDTPHYLDFLRMHPGETGALLQDLLISVTNFFRDREAFAALEAVIPTLFRGKGPKDVVRVWCAACATGEEAYSVAMLLSEHAGKLDHPPTFQVFATDLDENAIAQARDGSYPETISADVSEERLRRFFNKGHGKYRVKGEVRETVLFALHDLLKDSPFSRLDLVTCRNLLIYLNRDAQERALDIFHFSLNPEGVLFLGTSESVDDAEALFAVTDKKYRLYVRRTVARPKVPPVFTGPTALTQAMLRHRQEAAVLPRALPLPPSLAGAGAPDAVPTPDGERAPWSEVHSRGVERFGAPSVIIDSQHHLVHLSGHAGRLLQFSDGEATTHLLRVVHPMLRVELRAVIFRAEQSGTVAETFGVPVEIDGARRAVDLRVAPLGPDAPGSLLVIFTEREPVAGSTPQADAGGVEPAVRELERELEQSKATLRDTVEQSDANQEELQASNEELQAMNEELRSTSEELETGREELQSINEELTTVNQEMKAKVDELARSNSDLQNLMAATAIATVFLDRNLCIQRYTPPAVALFNLIPTDVGRPLADLTPRLRYPDLATEAERALESLAVSEREVSHPDGRTFLARLRPYRTEDDRIAGLVLTFVDISERKQGEEDLRGSEARFRAVTDLVPDLLWISDTFGVVHWFSQRWYQYTGQTPDMLPGRFGFDAVPAAERVGAEQRFLSALAAGGPYRDEFRLRRADGQERWHLIQAEPFREPDGRVSQWFGTCTDIDDLKRAAAMQLNFRQIFESAPGCYVVLEPGTFKVVAVSDAYLQATMTTRAMYLNKNIFEVFPDREEERTDSTRLMRASFERVKATGRADAMAVNCYPLQKPDGGTEERWWSPINSPVFGEGGALAYVIHRVEDVTAFVLRRRAEGRENEAFSELEDRTRHIEVDIVQRGQEMQRANDLLSDAQGRLRMAMAAGRMFSWEANPATRRFRWLSDVEGVVGFSLPEDEDGVFALVHPEDRAPKREAMQSALARGDGFVIDFRLVHPVSGEVFWFHTQAVVAADFFDGTPRFIGITENITERRRHEEERSRLLAAEQAARAEAEAAGQAKDHFLAVLSHELRTPLTPVMMAIHLLARNPELPESAHSALETIERNVKIEAHFIDDLLDITKIAHGKLEIVRDAMDLHDAVRHAVEVSAGDLQGKNQPITVALEAAEHQVNGDATRLQQAFWNLLKNASKFTPKGGAIHIASRNEPGRIVVEISDTGIGFDAEVATRIFDSFAQASLEVMRQFGGLGLGLAISKATVDAHEGTLSARSEGRNQGATFTVALPLLPPPKSRATGRPRAKRSPTRRHGPGGNPENAASRELDKAHGPDFGELGKR